MNEPIYTSVSINISFQKGGNVLTTFNIRRVKEIINKLDRTWRLKSNSPYQKTPPIIKRGSPKQK